MSEDVLGKTPAGLNRPPELTVQELFHADKKTIESFRAAIGRSNGLILLLVHPYYTDNYKWSEDEEESRAAAERTTRRIDAFISSESKVKPPIIVFEGEGKTADTMGYLREIAPNTEVLVASTMNGAPVPILPGSKNMYSSREQERAWKQMKASLHHLGVKKILLGGMYLGSHTWKGRPYLNLFSCVGDTNNALKNEFEVEMSSLTYPLTRKDYLRTLREESARPKPAGSGQQK